MDSCDPRDRHSSRNEFPPFGGPGAGIPAPGIPGYGVPRYEPSRYDPPSWGADIPAPPIARPDSPTGGIRRVAGLLDRSYEQTGPLVEPEWWAYGSSDDPQYPVARHGGHAGPGVGPGLRPATTPSTASPGRDRAEAPVRTAPAPPAGCVGPVAPP